MKTIRYMILALVTASMLSACKWATKSIDDTLHGRPTVDNTDYQASAYKGSDNFLTNTNALTAAEKSLRNIPELKSKTLKVYGDPQFYDDGRIMIQIMDPDTAGNVNEYDFNGQDWGPKTPVKVSAGEFTQVDNNSILLDSIPFTTIIKIAAAYTAKAIENNSKTSINHVYYVIDAKKWYTNDIENDRTTYQAYFNRDGSLQSFNRE